MTRNSNTVYAPFGAITIYRTINAIDRAIRAVRARFTRRSHTSSMVSLSGATLQDVHLYDDRA